MKKVFSLMLSVILVVNSMGQLCSTSSAMDICSPNSPATVTSFVNANLFSGVPLTAGAKYKFSNVTTIAGPPSQVLDAIVTIDAMVNATMSNSIAGASPSIDDDATMAQDNTSQAAFFSPRILPDQPLNCTSRRGYVQFTIAFYPHFAGNVLPAAFGVSGLNFIQFDMDGHTVGGNGWLKEIGYIKKLNAANPINSAAISTELTNGGTVSDAAGDWLLTLGSTSERNGISKCFNVAEASLYDIPQSSFTFRMGYDYKAPVPCNGINEGQPTRDYAAKFSCFSLPNGGPLPVSISSIGVNYNSGIATIGWTTFQEFNLVSYEIQRSLDGMNFESVGDVRAKNVLTKENYRFEDNVSAISSKYLYYRLRIIDRDNTFKVSNVVSIKMSGWKSNEMMITPNPSSSDAQLRFKANKGGTATINVIDASGKIALKQQAQILIGTNNISLINISTLAEGYYTVRLLINDESFSSKLLIWK